MHNPHLLNTALATLQLVQRLPFWCKIMQNNQLQNTSEWPRTGSYLLLSRKLRKVTKVTDSVWRNFFPIFLSTWGDSKSKGKVKKKFPENFGAFYPSENGPLGERLLNVTMHFSCLHLYVICDVVAHDWIHWIKLALRHFGKFWDPFSQWRCKISILPKGCQLVLSKHYYSRHQSYHMIIWKNWSGGFTLCEVVHFVLVK